MNAQQKISLGSLLASTAVAGIALSYLLDWTSLARPWGFLLGFVLGIAAGIGSALAITGLIERRRMK